jgi:hypothetical protein
MDKFVGSEEIIGGASKHTLDNFVTNFQHGFTTTNRPRSQPESRSIRYQGKAGAVYSGAKRVGC